jgi:hypothetical protein
MTCIAAVVEDGTVYMGGDSAGVAGLDITLRADEKVFINGPCLFGCTTSFRMLQLLKYQLQIPEHYSSIDVITFVHTVLIEAIRDTLKEYGWATVQNNVEDGGVFLLGYRGHLFRVENDYQVATPLLPFSACGCAEAYAKTALYLSSGKPPRARIQEALEVAEYFSGGVRNPFVIKQV